MDAPLPRTVPDAVAFLLARMPAATRKALLRFTDEIDLRSEIARRVVPGMSVRAMRGLWGRNPDGKREIAGRDYARGRHAGEFVAEQVSVDAWTRGLDVASDIDRIGGPGVRLVTLDDWDAENERLGVLLAKAKYLLGSRARPGEWVDAVPEAVRNLLSDAVAKARERLDIELESLA